MKEEFVIEFDKDGNIKDKDKMLVKKKDNEEEVEGD